MCGSLYLELATGGLVVSISGQQPGGLVVGIYNEEQVVCNHGSGNWCL